MIEKEKDKKKAIIGFSAGTSFSKFINSSRKYIYSPYYTITYENKYKLGISAGCYISLLLSKHFSIQPEIYYNLIYHDIKYVYRDSPTHWGQYEDNYANYSLCVSSIQASLMPKFKIGNKIKLYTGIGPYLNIPIFNIIKGQIEQTGVTVTFAQGSSYPIPISTNFDKFIKNNDIKTPINTTSGLDIALGVIIPYKERNFSIEMRVYSGSNIITFLNLKHYFATLCFTYELRKKES